jgi:uncharacterized lipoprotein YmbA
MKAFSVSKRAKPSSRGNTCPPTRGGRASSIDIGVFVVVTGLLLGCASGGGKTPQLTQYLLRSTAPATSGEVKQLGDVGIGRINVADYLDQFGIVVELQPGQIRPAKYHEWAESLSTGLRQFLRPEIAAVVGHDIDIDPTRQRHWRLTVDIDIVEFHGTLSGSARLNASWTLTDADGDLVGAYRFVETESLRQSGYGGLVDAQSTLAARLGAAVGQSIRDAGRVSAIQS